MSLITIARKRFTYHSDGRITADPIIEKHDWPAMTCGNFKRAYPDSVLSVDNAGSYAEPEPRKKWGREHQTRRFHRSGHASTPVGKKPIPAPVTSAFDLASMINEEVAKL